MPTFFTRKEILISLYAQIPVHLLEKFVHSELYELDDTTAIRAFFFARMNVLDSQLIKAQDVINQQQNELSKMKRRLENRDADPTI